MILVALLMLAMIYLFQRFDFSMLLPGREEQIFHPYFSFVFNKTIRFIFNDLACLLLISALFEGRKYMKVAVLVFLFELLIILPLYFVLKLNLEGDSEISSPLLSQIHRLIVNPTLMILLIIAFFYQRFREKNKQGA